MERAARPERVQPLQADPQYLLTYPKLANPVAEVLLENERVAVQWLVVGPGQWEGIHSRPGNPIYIHIQGGAWSERRGGAPFGAAAVAKTGSLGWMDAVERVDGHESGNTADTTVDPVWVTLK